MNVKTKTTPSVNVALRDLKAFTNYSIRIAAFTSVGEGPYSKYLSCSTEEDGKNDYYIFYMELNYRAIFFSSWNNQRCQRNYS